MKLKVGIVGSHGVGKSTLAAELSKLTNTPLIIEIARNHNVNTKDRREYFHIQKNILNDQLAAEWAHESTGYISDRTTIDNLAYFKAGAKYTPDEYSDYEQKAKFYRFEYSHIFYLPIEFGLEDDGFRFVDVDYQKQIDVILMDILSTVTANVHTITGTHNERVEQAMKILKEELHATLRYEKDECSDKKSTSKSYTRLSQGQSRLHSTPGMR